MLLASELLRLSVQLIKDDLHPTAVIAGYRLAMKVSSERHKLTRQYSPRRDRPGGTACPGFLLGDLLGLKDWRCDDANHPCIFVREGRVG